MKKLVLALCVFSGVGMTQVKAQGESDPGLTTLGALQNGQGKHDVEKSAVALAIPVGMGENDAMIYSPQLEIKMANEKGYFEFKLPYHYIAGDLAKNFGIGDLTATYTMPIKMKSKSMTMQGTAGFRFGMGSASDDDKGQPLPMAYQTSLGTTDVIVGVGAKVGKYLNLALGVQQPVLQYNTNNYSRAKLGDADTTFFASRKLKRAGDVMLRVEGQYDLKNMGFNAGPLLMYHIMDDKMKMVNGTDSTLTGSAGMTLNVTAGWYYKTSKWRLDLSAGIPVIQRDYRPDGLTRSFVVCPRFTLFL